MVPCLLHSHSLGGSPLRAPSRLSARALQQRRGTRVCYNKDRAVSPARLVRGLRVLVCGLPPGPCVVCQCIAMVALFLLRIAGKLTTPRETQETERAPNAESEFLRMCVTSKTPRRSVNDLKHSLAHRTSPHDSPVGAPTAHPPKHKQQS